MEKGNTEWNIMEKTNASYWFWEKIEGIYEEKWKDYGHLLC